ncbi:hypothetical protein HY989_06690 [Candidatus Micrarchaeota archaeon]|nr:hypothetical protein [Candidatus Micrarchaeota archaeon]
MIGKFVKGSTAALGLLNQRAFTILLFLVGIGGVALFAPQAIFDGVTKREAAGIILLVFLPYLILKAIVLLLLLALDISINFSANTTYTYKVNYEKAKARVAKLLLDRNVNFTKLDNFELGVERYLVSVMQRYLTGTKFNYPTNFISKSPFIVIRIYDLKNGSTQVKVIFEEEHDAEVNGRLVIATLQALEKEESDKSPKMQSMFIAGSIKPVEAPKEETNSAVILEIPKKLEEKKSSGSLIDKLKFRKKKK